MLVVGFVLGRVGLLGRVAGLLVEVGLGFGLVGLGRVGFGRFVVVVVLVVSSPSSSVVSGSSLVVVVLLVVGGRFVVVVVVLLVGRFVVVVVVVGFSVHHDCVVVVELEVISDVASGLTRPLSGVNVVSTGGGVGGSVGLLQSWPTGSPVCRRPRPLLRARSSGKVSPPQHRL